MVKSTDKYEQLLLRNQPGNSNVYVQHFVGHKRLNTAPNTHGRLSDPLPAVLVETVQQTPQQHICVLCWSQLQEPVNCKPACFYSYQTGLSKCILLTVAVLIHHYSLITLQLFL